MNINCNTDMVTYIGASFIPSRHTKTMKRMATDYKIASGKYNASLFVMTKAGNGFKIIDCSNPDNVTVFESVDLRFLSYMRERIFVYRNYDIIKDAVVLFLKNLMDYHCNCIRIPDRDGVLRRIRHTTPDDPLYTYTNDLSLMSYEGMASDDWQPRHVPCVKYNVIYAPDPFVAIPDNWSCLQIDSERDDDDFILVICNYTQLREPAFRHRLITADQQFRKKLIFGYMEMKGTEFVVHIDHRLNSSEIIDEMEAIQLPNPDMDTKFIVIYKDGTTSDIFKISVCLMLEDPYFVDTLRHANAHIIYYISNDILRLFENEAENEMARNVINNPPLVTTSYDQ